MRTKILLGYACIFLLVAVFIYTYFPFKHKQQAMAAIEFKMRSMTDMMTIGVEVGLRAGVIDRAAIGEVLSWAKKDSSLAYIVILNAAKEQVVTYQVGHLPIQVNELIKSSNGFQENRIVHYKQPLSYQSQAVGMLLIGYSLQHLDRDIALQQRTTLYICLAIFGFGLVLSVAISTRITSNITKLGEVVNKIAEGNTHTRFSISNNDEIGKLADAFNEMIVKLNDSREELLSSNQYTENIIMSMLDSLLVLDEHHNIVRANRAACTLLEYTEAEILGKNIYQLFEKNSFVDSFLPTLEEIGHLQSQENTYVTQSGKAIDVLFSAAMLRDSHGLHQGIVCVAQDISERKKGEAQLVEYSQKLEKSNQELEKFNYVISHDLKAPLRALFKLSEWIQEDMGDALSEESSKNFDIMRGRISRMEALINGLSAYSQTRWLIKVPEAVSVEPVLQEVIQQLAPPDTCTICIQPDMPTFVTHRKRLQHVFIHLISNAIRFNDKTEGKIRISVIEQEQYYQFSVEDNGEGIDTKYFDKVFVIFQTLQARDRVESTGIGLAIAKKIVEEHKGKIWVDSIVGQGATFSFLWPKEI
ncbi:MAG: ATP-binding protein [Bacteroidota bacterium]